MIYLDTNILLYATLTKVDTPSQQDRAIEILKELIDNDYAFKNSFDLYHVAFANSYECEKLITFDKGFKKFYAVCGVEIEIL